MKFLEDVYELVPLCLSVHGESLDQPQHFRFGQRLEEWQVTMPRVGIGPLTVTLLGFCGTSGLFVHSRDWARGQRA